MFPKSTGRPGIVAHSSHQLSWPSSFRTFHRFCATELCSSRESAGIYPSRRHCAPRQLAKTPPARTGQPEIVNARPGWAYEGRYDLGRWKNSAIQIVQQDLNHVGSGLNQRYVDFHYYPEEDPPLQAHPPWISVLTKRILHTTWDFHEIHHPDSNHVEQHCSMSFFTKDGRIMGPLSAKALMCCASPRPMHAQAFPSNKQGIFSRILISTASAHLPFSIF